MTVRLLLGIGLAVVASTLYSLGIALQALDAREVPAGHSLRLSLVRQLVTRVRWLAGTGLSIVGWPFQVGALYLAPLIVVQPALAAGLLVLLAVGTRMLGERAGRREKLAVAAILIGVVGLAWTAPERSTLHASRSTLIPVLTVLGVAALAPYLLRLARRTVTGVTMLGAGLAFAWGGVTTKLVSDAVFSGHWRTAAIWGVITAASSGVAVLSEMSALQTRPAIQVAPVVFVVQTMVPVALAPLLVHERFAGSPLRALVLVSSLVVLAVGAVFLARSPVLLALMAGDISLESDEVDSPEEASRARSASSAAVDVESPSSVNTTTSPARSGR